MDVSVKKLLKSARQSLAEKKYEDALSHCKSALQQDRSCYEVYVLVGKAAFHLREFQQAEAAYTRATSLEGTNLLAWQGLAELHSETGAWDQAFEANATLAQLAAGSIDAGTQSRLPSFIRRAAESAMSAGLFAEADMLWRQLIDLTPIEGPAHLEVICRLADCQLAAEDRELAERVAAASYLTAGSAEAVEKDLIEADWARAGLEQEDGISAAVTLREIMALAPPSPPYAPYYEAYLYRLRKAAKGAPVGSMERHSRRTAVLNFSLHAIHGMSGTGVAGGCCTPTPFEAALAMLEVEGNVASHAAGRTTAQPTPTVGSPVLSRQPSGTLVGGLSPKPSMSGLASPTGVGLSPIPALSSNHTQAGTFSPQEIPAATLLPPGPDLQLTGMDYVAKRLVHAFPWSPAASVHLALCNRRAAAGHTHKSSVGTPTHHAKSHVTDLGRQPAAGGRRMPAAAKRRRHIKLILSGLRKGGASTASAAAWLAASEMLLEEGAPEAALDAAKQGLGYLAARELLGHEALVQADLLLKLAAGRALAAMACVPAPGASGYSMEIMHAVLIHQPSTTEPQQLSNGNMPNGHATVTSPSRRSINRSYGFPETLKSRALKACKHLEPGAQMERTALEAVAWLRALLLSGRVGGGPAPFAKLAGSVAAGDLVQQATRCLAQLALVLGDVQRAREMYESLVGAAAMGRVDPYSVYHWALAEYGALLAAQGECASALQQLEGAIKSLAQSMLLAGEDSMWGESRATQAALATRYHLLAAHVCWQLGGAVRCDRGVGAHSHLLAAAATAEAAEQYAVEADSAAAAAARADAADAFSLLGRWYLEHGSDVPRAAKCCQRALALDPSQEAAGETLVQLLINTSDPNSAATALKRVCEDCIARCAAMTEGTEAEAIHPPPSWAIKTLARLQLQAKDAAAAMTSLQNALRSNPSDVGLWELLGAAYQQLGRQSAASRAYSRALELSPNRLYCLLQLGTLLLQQGSSSEALQSYQRALALQPHHPAALLGAAECLLATGVHHALAGAHGLAARALQGAATHARECTKHHSRLVAGWKALGDVLLQHADVTPAAPEHPAAGGGTVKEGGGVVSADDMLAGRTRRRAALAASRRAYAAALHLDPTQGHVWGDVSMAAYQSAVAAHDNTNKDKAADPLSADQLFRLASRTIRGALRLDPTNDALWAQAGETAAGQSFATLSPGSEQTAKQESPKSLLASAEFCLTRALQLKPRCATAWVTLARLYALKGEGELAATAAERCRLAEPRLVAVWEAMAALAEPECKTEGDAGYKAQVDAWEHAVGLGGGYESWLGYATGAVIAGQGSTANVFSVALKAVQSAHIAASPAALNTLGLALESRGRYGQAAKMYSTARAILEQQQQDGAAGLPSGSIWLVDPTASSSVSRQASNQSSVLQALQLNEARALAKDGQHAQALQLYDQLHSNGSVGAQSTCHAIKAHASLMVGNTDKALQEAEAAMKQAQEQVERLSTNKNGSSAAATIAQRRLLGCALAFVYASLKAGKARQALEVVKRQCWDVPIGSATLSQVALQLWLVVLTAAAASQLQEAAVASPVDISYDEVSSDLQLWVASRPELDQAWVKAHIFTCESALAAARSQHKVAYVKALHALHTCPWDQVYVLKVAAAASYPGSSSRLAACARLSTTASPAIAASHSGHPSRHSQEVVLKHLPLSAIPAAGSAPAVSAGHTLSYSNLTPSLLDDAPPRMECGYELQAAAVLAVQPADKQSLPLVSQVVSQLVQVVHMAPCEPGGWYLLALLSLQQAAMTGQCGLYRKALARCRIALVHARRAFTRASEPQQTTSDGNGNASTPAATSGPDSKPGRLLSGVMLRLLAATSECLLHSRVPNGTARAKEAATESLRWALQNSISPGIAHRQLARVATATGDTANAELAYSNAVQNGDLPALVDFAHLTARISQQQQQQDGAGANDAAGGASKPSQAHIPQSLEQALANLMETGKPAEKGDGNADTLLASSGLLLNVVKHMEAQDWPAARDALQQLQSQNKLPAASQAAAYVLQSRLAALLSHEGGSGQPKPDANSSTPTQTPHQLAVEARWAANASMKQLATQTATISMAAGHPQSSRAANPARCLAGACLAAAELLMNKQDRAANALAQSIATSPAPGTTTTLLTAAASVAAAGKQATASDRASAIRMAARAVHMNPGAKPMWEVLRTAIAAAS